MCELCSQDAEERKKAVEGCHAMADRLERLAKMYRELSSGHRKPHGPSVDGMAATAKNAIRDLVNEWV